MQDSKMAKLGFKLIIIMDDEDSTDLDQSIADLVTDRRALSKSPAARTQRKTVTTKVRSQIGLRSERTRAKPHATCDLSWRRARAAYARSQCFAQPTKVSHAGGLVRGRVVIWTPPRGQFGNDYFLKKFWNYRRNVPSSGAHKDGPP